MSSSFPASFMPPGSTYPSYSFLPGFNSSSNTTDNDNSNINDDNSSSSESLSAELSDSESNNNDHPTESTTWHASTHISLVLPLDLQLLSATVTSTTSIISFNPPSPNVTPVELTPDVVPSYSSSGPDVAPPSSTNSTSLSNFNVAPSDRSSSSSTTISPLTSSSSSTSSSNKRSRIVREEGKEATTTTSRRRNPAKVSAEVLRLREQANQSLHHTTKQLMKNSLSAFSTEELEKINNIYGGNIKRDLILDASHTESVIKFLMETLIKSKQSQI